MMLVLAQSALSAHVLCGNTKAIECRRLQQSKGEVRIVRFLEYMSDSDVEPLLIFVSYSDGVVTMAGVTLSVMYYNQ
jgi:hypothetical protein